MTVERIMPQNFKFHISINGALRYFSFSSKFSASAVEKKNDTNTIRYRFIDIYPTLYLFNNNFASRAALHSNGCIRLQCEYIFPFDLKVLGQKPQLYKSTPVCVAT